jgi:chaperonin GroEL (HSP60 family)
MNDIFAASNDYEMNRNREKIEGLLKVIENSIQEIKLANNGGFAHVHAAHRISQMAIDLLMASVELEQQSKIKSAVDYVTQLN